MQPSLTYHDARTAIRRVTGRGEGGCEVKGKADRRACLLVAQEGKELYGWLVVLGWCTASWAVRVRAGSASLEWRTWPLGRQRGWAGSGWLGFRVGQVSGARLG